jgi:hypothetical protein
MKASERFGSVATAARIRFTPARHAQTRLTARNHAQAAFLSPPDKSSAIGSVDLCCSQIVRMAIIIGRPIKAPAIPQRKLQKNTASRTMNGDIDKAAPAIRGSPPSVTDVRKLYGGDRRSVEKPDAESEDRDFNEHGEKEPSGRLYRLRIPNLPDLLSSGQPEFPPAVREENRSGVVRPRKT